MHMQFEKQFLVHAVTQNRDFFSNENMFCRVAWISMTFVIFEQAMEIRIAIALDVGQ